MNKTTKTKKAH